MLVLQYRGKKAQKGLIVRVESKWRPGELLLWLIAAIAATLIVCSRSSEAPPPEAAPAAPSTSAPTGDFDLEFDVVE